MVFTRMAGGPFGGEAGDERRRHGGIGGVGYLAPDAAGEFTQCLPGPVNGYYRQAAGGEVRCCGAPERAPRPGHDRHMNGHDAYLLTAVGITANFCERTRSTLEPVTVRRCHLVLVIYVPACPGIARRGAHIERPA